MRLLQCITSFVMKIAISILFLLPFGQRLKAQPLFDSPDLVRRPRTYDILHYKLDLSFDEHAKRVLGTSHITFTPLSHSLDSMVLDAVEMNISAVNHPSGTELRYVNETPELTLFFDRSYSHGDTVTVSIQYTCTPQKGLYFIQPDSSDFTRRWQIWTQGEEEDNRCWFPCYDFPDDKASSEVVATVQERYTVLSNGRFLSEVHNTTNRTRTFHWKQEKPHASYLIMIAAGEYSILADTYRGIPLLNYVYPKESGYAPRSFQKTPAMMKFFEETIGFPYPWEKYAHIIIDQFMYGGMENTSAVTLNEAYIYDARAAINFSTTDVVAHELAHQWWGDVVTCNDWSHLWLNEGFANYYEGLFKQHNLGKDEFLYEQYTSSQGVLRAEESLGRKPIVSAKSFGVNLYQKGAWVLRMLNALLGEEIFQKALHHYINKYQFTSVTTEDFASAVEEVSGTDLDWFFEQWVYKAGHPNLHVTTDWVESSNHLKVTIIQQQVIDSLTGVFRFPLDVECTMSSGSAITRVWVEDKEETFIIPLDEKPALVIVDKGLNLLKTLIFPKAKSDYVYQLLRATDAPDRLEALENLELYSGDQEVFQAAKWSALNDQFWAVQVAATRLLGTLEAEGKKAMLFEIYQDRDARVREAAITELGKFKGPDVASFIESAALSDSSYVVLATCLRTMPAIDSARAFDLASRFVDMSSYRDMVRRASLNTFRALRCPLAIPLVKEYLGPDYDPFTRTTALGVLREVGKMDTGTRQLIQDLIADPNASVRASAVRTLGHWGGTEFNELLKSRLSLEKSEEVLRIINEVIGTESGVQ